LNVGESSAIEWTDATVNFWWGCTKVGPGCDHCYAEAWAKRTGLAWGLDAARRQIKGAVKLLYKLHNGASWWAADYHIGKIVSTPRRRVFIQSMSDLFDTEVPLDWLAEAWKHIERCDALAIQIVTKRVSVVEKRLAAIGVTTWPKHAGLIISVVNQEEADRDIPRLLALAARLGIPWLGLSMEPLLGPVVIRDHWLIHHHPGDAAIDWVIVGGESGGKARPMHPDWVRSLRDQCKAAGVAFLFKQWGEWIPAIDRENEDPDWRADYTNALADTGKTRWLNLAGGCGFHGERFHVMRRVGKKAAGRLLDGAEHNGLPNFIDQVPA
jgi:protein gp37